MRLLKALLIIFVVLVALAIVLVWTLPADVAVRRGQNLLGPVVLTGVRGTVWHGHADGISAFGRDLGEIDWNLAKLPLLTGHVHADIRIQGNDVDAAGVLDRTDFDTLTLRDVRFRFPAELLAPALAIPDLHLLGTVTGAIDEASLRGGYIAAAEGNARWSEAGVDGEAEARFSDILAEFHAVPGGGIEGTAHDDGRGNLAVDAKFHANIAGFEADAKLAARNGDPQVAEMLRHVGAPAADGSSELIVRGKMFKVF